jgi:Putative Flp pilus-assembly TadE/G-like
MISAKRPTQGGQVMVIVAVALLALIGSAALVLLAGSAEWQKNQLQQLADQAALDSALQIGVSCDLGKATTVITEADVFLASQRARTGSLSALAGTCATQYQATDTFGSMSATYNYPYRAHQQQVEVILTLTLPISFGGEVGRNSTTVTRRAVAQTLAASVPAVSATTLSCTGGQVNVAGTVAAQNAIALSGGCALYAHTRFDATSGTYSDLGNVSVYADGQAWVGGGGLCAAGANAGSTNAICADGAELSGHLTPACGTNGTSAFLSAGGSAINPHPCAAGVALPPVAPVSTALPPEPNTDPAAIASLQGTGGAACTPGGVYPAIVAGGTTWGTGLAPAPIKDASGYYHFKPSCYGYLTMASLAGGISNRQTGTETVVMRHFVTATLPAASIAGTLLVAEISSLSASNTITAPAGWVLAATSFQAGEGRNQIWYYPNNPGGIANIRFTVLPAAVDTVAEMTEWSGVVAASPLDRTGTLAVGAATNTATISTSAATTMPNELVITNDGFKIAAGQTFTPGAGWATLVNDATNGFGSEYRLDLPAAVASEAVTTSQPSLWSLAIATFKPAGVASAAVLDPGFYYFNGSGFGGGGGICLNSGRLMARDVTLEFVNQTGFSSGTCAPGGGATGCAGSCAFGSTPCSISACPPNAPFDPASGGGYTWFGAPCATAPTGDASCPGSAWCPVGDRACWNLLIWAPSSNTGQFAITGSAASAWLLGSTFWPGACTYAVNGKSSIAGTIACGSLSISAGAGAATAVGSDSGVNTALVEAVLIE